MLDVNGEWLWWAMVMVLGWVRVVVVLELELVGVKAWTLREMALEQTWMVLAQLVLVQPGLVVVVVQQIRVRVRVRVRMRMEGGCRQSCFFWVDGTGTGAVAGAVAGAGI